MMSAGRGNKITVLGAGSWGTALAVHLAKAGKQVQLWGNEPEHMELLNKERCNKYFLPDIVLPDTIDISSDLEKSLNNYDYILLAIPSHAFRSFLKRASTLIKKEKPLIWATKGLEEGSGKLLHEVVAEELPDHKNTAVISGPTFAREVARGMPTAISVASFIAPLADEIRDLLHHEHFRAYSSNDVIGVELGGALKNVLAIAAGIADGLGFGSNTRAALITRGLNEIIHLGEIMGGSRETFMGLAGIGDLVLTCTDDQSRNRRMGLMLAKNISQSEIRKKIGQEVEGVLTAREAVRLSEKFKLELPIMEQVYKVLYENKSPKDAVTDLFNRKLTSEFQ